MATHYGLKRHKHRCFSCEYDHYNNHLEYYPYHQCKLADYREISLGCSPHVDRMEWCPLYGPETDNEEMEEY